VRIDFKTELKKIKLGIKIVFVSCELCLCVVCCAALCVAHLRLEFKILWCVFCVICVRYMCAWLLVCVLVVR